MREDQLRAAIRANPADIGAWQGLADLAIGAGASDAALTILNQAARLGLRGPGLSARAAACFARKNDAMAARHWYRQALDEGLMELPFLIAAGLFFFDILDWPSAADAIDRRSRLEPDALIHRLDLATVHIAANHYAGALAVLDQSRPLWPTAGKLAEDVGIMRIICQAHLGIWDDFLNCAPALAARPPSDGDRQSWLFLLAYHPELTAAEILPYYRDWGQALTRQEGGLARDDRRFAQASRKVLGILSGDLFDSSMRAFMGGLLQALRGMDFKIIAYNTRPLRDSASHSIESAVDLIRDVSRLEIPALQDLIIADQVGTLIDAAALTLGGRSALFARRAAPLQLVWLGTGYTSGLPAMDGFIGDGRLLPPGAEDAFVEPRLLRLESGFGVWSPPANAGDPAPAPAEDAPVTFICTARPVRFNRLVYDTWAGILAQVPGSRMILNCRGLREDGGRALVAAQFGLALAAAGVESERVTLMEESPPWDSYRQADVALDPFPHNAATTCLDALWLGLPVVTLAGRPPAGTWAASILEKAGRPEWVAQSPQEYAAKAVALAHDWQARAAARQNLRPALAASSLLDPAAFAKSFRAEYQRVSQEVFGKDGTDE